MLDKLYNRAQILIEQNRFEEANKILLELLTTEPNNPHILSMCSEISYQLEDNERAINLINDAIGLAPDNDSLYYIKSKILLELEKYDESEKNLSIAISINPQDSDYFSLWASIKLARKQYDKAFELANKSLELDPENIIGLNTRSTSLLKLNRSEEAFETIKDALHEDPNNAYTHANFGWNLLEKNDSKRALLHFKEALKIDPNYSYAQAGMVEALKSKYFIYRIFLQYSFWMGNMAAKYQWGFIIGMYVLFHFLNNLANTNEKLRPFLIPVLVVLGLFAFSTWIINPVSNLFLRLNKYGRHLLDKKEIMSSNFVFISVLVCVFGLLSFLFFNEYKWLVIAGFGLTMMIPLSVMFADTKPKKALIYYSIVLSIIGFLSIVVSFNSGVLINGITTIYILGLIGFQWGANFLMIKQDNI